MLRRALEIWNAFWFPCGPPHALGLLRISLGLFVFGMWAKFFPHVTLMFSDQGFYFPYADNPAFIGTLDQFLSAAIGTPSPTQAWVCYLALLISILGFTLGAFYRVSASAYVLLLMYHYYLYTYNGLFSYDRLLFIISVVMVFSPAGQALSVDSWLSRRRGEKPVLQTPLWTQRLLCVQISLMYFATGVAKLTSKWWYSGDVMEQALISEWSSPLGFWLSRLDPPLGLLDIMAATAIVFEIIAGYMLFQKRWQKLFMVSGALFHLFNATVLVVWQFMFVPLLYVLYFDPGALARRAERLLGSPEAEDIPNTGEVWWDPISAGAEETP